MTKLITHLEEITHFHFCCGLRGAKKGFNAAKPQVNGLAGVFRCIGGIDNDRDAIRDFDRAGPGRPGTVMDLFTREQYTAFHGRPPPDEWKEATAEDIRRAAGYERPNIVFISAPCKGASGLLSETLSLSPKYQALNALTLRCVWLMREAWADDPADLIGFENVPRFATRCLHLRDQIRQLLQPDYAVNETTHDCGELGALAQRRKRFLLVGRHIDKVPPFLFEPQRKPLRAVGDVLGRMPLPGDSARNRCPMRRLTSHSQQAQKMPLSLFRHVITYLEAGAFLLRCINLDQSRWVPRFRTKSSKTALNTWFQLTYLALGC